MLGYHGNELAPIGYTNYDIQSNRDSRKSTSRYIFTLGGASVSWGVSSNHALLIQLWKLNMWQH